MEELSNSFGVSGVTVRGDLNELYSQCEIERVFGGAILLDKESKPEIPFTLRKKRQQTEKKSIAKVAAHLINDGDVIFLEGTTTIAEMAPHLIPKHDLTVITNSLEIAYQLAISSNVNVITIGGRLKRETLTLVGYSFDNILKEINIGKAFISAAGFTIEDGLTDISPEEITLLRRVIEMSKEVIALIDSTKWGKVSLIPLLETHKNGTIISDFAAPQSMVKLANELGIRTIIASTSDTSNQSTS